MHDQDDAARVERYLNGEERAFAELYAKYRPRLAAYCYRLLLDAARTEEAVQAVFARAVESIRSLRNPSSFRSWLFTMARNEIYGLLRTARAGPTVELSEDVWDTETPHENAVRGEVVRMVREALDRLKVEYREVLILRQFEGLSYAEIAAITGNSISSVESRLFKARRALTRELEPYFDSRSES